MRISPSCWALVACLFWAGCSGSVSGGSGVDSVDSGNSVDCDPNNAGCGATCASSGNCATDQFCVDDSTGFTCELCEAGALLSNGGGDTTCGIDINECTALTFSCATYEACENTHGSYACVPMLVDLTASPGALVFDPAINSYTLEVDGNWDAMTLTPTATEGVSVTINDTPVASGQVSGPIALTFADDGTRITIQVNAAGRTAEYLVVVRRAISTTQSLKAETPETSASFGHSVAINGDTMIVGAFSAGDGGAAYVFVRSGASWTQQAQLKAEAPAASDYFGYSVAIAGDTVIVGASGSTATDSGAAYVFLRSGTSWTQQAYLTAETPAANDNFGRSVAIAGETVIVGASGAAYVFLRSGTSWTQQAYLEADTPAANASFGGSVAIAADTVVVGAPVEDSAATNSGAAYVFLRSGTSWTQQAYLKAETPGAGDCFGYSVAIADDTVVVGAWSEDSAAVESGAAYVFLRSGTSWTQQAYLKAETPPGYDRFGWSVAIAGDTVVVGTWSAYSSDTAYVFRRSGVNWTQQANLKAEIAGGNQGDGQGSSVAIAGDTVVLGNPGGESVDAFGL